MNISPALWGSVRLLLWGTKDLHSLYKDTTEESVINCSAGPAGRTPASRINFNQRIRPCSLVDKPTEQWNTKNPTQITAYVGKSPSRFACFLNISPWSYVSNKRKSVPWPCHSSGGFFFNLHSGGWSPNWVHSTRRPLTGLLYLPRVIMRMEKLVEWMAGETEVLGENLPRRHFLHHKSHLTRPGIEPGPPRWEASD
jgi:hypothetical protein